MAHEEQATPLATRQPPVALLLSPGSATRERRPRRSCLGRSTSVSVAERRAPALREQESSSGWRLSRPALRERADQIPRSTARARLEGHDAVALGEEPRHVRGCHPASVDLVEVLVGRPTGDGAALSDEDRDCVVSQLGEEFTRRRHAHALHPVRVVVQEKLGRIATQDDSTSPVPPRRNRWPPGEAGSRLESRRPCRH